MLLFPVSFLPAAPIPSPSPSIRAALTSHPCPPQPILRSPSIPKAQRGQDWRRRRDILGEARRAAGVGPLRQDHSAAQEAQLRPQRRTLRPALVRLCARVARPPDDECAGKFDLLRIEANRGLRQWIEMGPSESRWLTEVHAEELKTGRSSTMARAPGSAQACGRPFHAADEKPSPYQSTSDLVRILSTPDRQCTCTLREPFPRR
ncbi:hypothetical protein SETIT_6G093500v2 [Setaria italica]|uniref:Uncharacterized protein n=1 Tax=Setaria italica TaxID=4555 RepID=A0A368RJP7_SETIT|nr:hypothetical protein SETIT_6G093500v2 [Setaria italica]